MRLVKTIIAFTIVPRYPRLKLQVVLNLSSKAFGVVDLLGLATAGRWLQRVAQARPVLELPGGAGRIEGWSAQGPCLIKGCHFFATRWEGVALMPAGMDIPLLECRDLQALVGDVLEAILYIQVWLA
jgi:hypothetical protein